MKTVNGCFLVSFIVLASIFYGCSQEEDDYDNTDMYTMAEEMGTRLVEPPPVNNVTLSDTVYNTYEITLSRRVGKTQYTYTANIDVMMYRRNNIPDVELRSYYCPASYCSVDEVWMQARQDGTGYLLYAKGRNGSGIEYTGFLENYVFF